MVNSIASGKIKIVTVMGILMLISLVNIFFSYSFNQSIDLIFLIIRTITILSLCILILLGFYWAKTIIEWLVAIPTFMFLIGIAHVFDKLLVGLISLTFLIVYVFCIFLLASGEVDEYIEKKRNSRKVKL